MNTEKRLLMGPDGGKYVATLGEFSPLATTNSSEWWVQNSTNQWGRYMLAQDLSDFSVLAASGIVAETIGKV